ncbi:MAG: exodeoxyribonuclease III [Proteobacteria bacterium]|nr:exodeoxyribonuclease III [Pseudomonadota bacterium]MYJ95375.1 exodeoxyribonuclease III [Pseudomonadota bacterium]
MKIATWNVNSLRVRLEHVTDWLKQAQPDVLGLQETKVTDELFPADAFEDLGYHVAYSGQPTYNGVAVVSRLPPADVVVDLDGFDDPARRVLCATYGDVRVLNLYVPNGQSVGSEKYDYKLAWLAALDAHLRRDLQRHKHVVAVGDFNIAPDDRDVHDPVQWEGKILCSPRERSALGDIIEAGFKDTFRLFEQEEKSFSWWDYRAGAFRRNNGLRIDLILASDGMSAACTGCSIDVAPRRLQRPSDHTPVVAEFSLP